MSGPYFTDFDAAGDDTIWLDRGEFNEPLAVIRECDLPPTARNFWPVIVAAFTNGDTA